MKNILIGIIMLLLVVAMAWFGVWPAYQGWVAAKQSRHRVAQELAKLQKRDDQIRQLEATSETLRAKAILADQLIPIQEKREDFATEMESVAKSHGLSLSTMSFQAGASSKKAKEESSEENATKTAVVAKQATNKAKPKKIETTRPVGFKMVLGGSFAGVQEFLIQLNQSQRYTHVTDFSIGRNGDQTSITLSGQIFTKVMPPTSDQISFTEKDWAYLDRPPADTTIPALPDGSAGRADPFATY